MFHIGNKVGYNPQIIPDPRKTKQFHYVKSGSLVALITPMNQDGSIHYEQLAT